MIGKRNQVGEGATAARRAQFNADMAGHQDVVRPSFEVVLTNAGTHTPQQK
jgi:hypothetical protein